MRSLHRPNRRETQAVAFPRSGRCDLSAVLFLAVMLCGASAAGQQTKKAGAEPEPKAEDLLTADAFPKKWKHVSSDKKAVLANTWGLNPKTKIPELNCTGKPPGYVRTAEEFTNFDLTLEWLYPKDEECNSGVLLYCGADKVWPASVQVQLHRPFAGSIFPSPGATTASNVTIKSLKLAIGVWHKCRIRSVNGTITVWINGKQVGVVTNCKPSSGYIGLQSEGYPIKFRRFEITRLKDSKKPAAKTSPTKKVPAPRVSSKTAPPAGAAAKRRSP